MVNEKQERLRSWPLETVATCKTVGVVHRRWTFLHRPPNGWSPFCPSWVLFRHRHLSLIKETKGTMNSSQTRNCHENSPAVSEGACPPRGSPDIGIAPPTFWMIEEEPLLLRYSRMIRQLGRLRRKPILSPLSVVLSMVVRSRKGFFARSRATTHSGESQILVWTETNQRNLWRWMEG